MFTFGRCFSASNNIFFQGQCTSYQGGTQNPRTTPSCSSLVRSFKYRNDASDFSSSLPTTKNVVALKDTPADRPHNVKFVAPLLDYGYPPAVDCLKHQQDATPNVPEREEDVRKPILLYLPGFDGTYICPFLQFPELGTEFEVWCMTVGMKDRSTYQELKTIVLDFIKKELDHDGCDVQQLSDTIPIIDRESSSETFDGSKDVSGIFRGIFGGGNLSALQKIKHSRRRPIYLAGESFGGILASDVALTLLTKKRNSRIALDERGQQPVDLQGLVLINPATCYDRSQLALKGPQVSQMPKPLYLMGLFSQLLPLFTDEHSVSQLGLILQGKALPSVIDNPQREAYMGRVAISLPSKLEFMPPDTLAWRLEKWLETGCSQMRESTFKLFPKFRTLIVVGEKDKTLPSIAEAERLTNKVLLPSQTKVHVVEGAGHASTCGSRLDLAAVMRNHFIELQKPNKKENQQSKQEKNQTEAQSKKKEKRTSMKAAAEVGTGPFFGMEERYDKAKIGLNPILYWSKSNYTPVQLQIEDRLVTMPGSKQVSYKKANYKVPK
ncbi:lysophospholipase [Nitzschia inconspicua]|uniref:Lysophospholipase n=1 Tax=Nitzschia inconspicua TaxID=303405 RepID=A0A9K3M625_9STRA|nr:lysophospholipase [Nitzschia inconspicua]